MLPHLRPWVVLLLLLGTLTYAIAEEITLTTYYPSPRGVYRELRVGSGGLFPTPTGTLQILKPSGDATPAFRVDYEDIGASSFIIDQNGRVGIGGDPQATLDVAGGIRVQNAPDASPEGVVRWTGADFEGRNATEWVRFMSMPEGSNVTMQYVSGANPPCPAGSGIPMMKKWTLKTCPGDGFCGTPDCISGGWATGGPGQCPVTTYYGGGEDRPAGCYTDSYCASDSWTEAICMGN